jgi:hypothetical protein
VLEEEKEGDLKISVIDTLKVIPPPSMLKEDRRKTVVEKRIRIRRSPSTEENKARISPSLAKELGLSGDAVEIVVAGRKSLQLAPIIDESVPENEVWVNENLLKLYGIADNTIATIRRASKR